MKTNEWSIWLIADEVGLRRWIVAARTEGAALTTVGLGGHPMGNSPNTPLVATRMGALDLDPGSIREAARAERLYTTEHLDPDDYGIRLCSSYPWRG